MSIAITIGIDPGLDECGVAEFQDGVLGDAWLARSECPRGEDVLVRAGTMAEKVASNVFAICGNARVVIEWPRVYLPGKSRGDNNDLLVVTAVAGALSALAAHVIPHCSVESVLPDEWRYGQAKKNVMRGRIVERLDEDERRILGEVLQKIPPSMQNHVEDAVGIGLYALGRLKPRVVV